MFLFVKIFCKVIRIHDPQRSTGINTTACSL
jgi:hypothetical protein